MHSSSRPVARPTLVLGGICILLGVGLNPWFLGWVAADGDIESGLIRGLILAVDVVLIGVGAALLVFRPAIRVQELGLLAGTLLLGLVGLEGAVRYGVGQDPLRGTLRLDDELGWVPQADYERVIEDHAIYGTVRYSTGPDGFRRSGSGRGEEGVTRILFLGDSGTQANQVSDGEPYYDVIERLRPDVDVFAFGAGGYSTLQEYMVLDRSFDEVRPDVVVVQFSPNDIMNNSYALESRSAFNSRMRRPYLEDGEIVHRFPSRNPLIRHTALGRFIAVRLDFIGSDNERFRRRSVEYQIERYRELWDDGIDTTVEILRRAQDQTGDVPVVAFETSPSYLDGDTLFARIARLAGIDFIDGVPAALDSAVAAGASIDFSPYDGHWNEEGHAIAAGVIVDGLVDLGYLPGN